MIVNRLRIYTDDKNLKSRNFNTNILLRCRLVIEDYVIDIKYIKCDKNILADTL